MEIKSAPEGRIPAFSTVVPAHAYARPTHQSRFSSFNTVIHLLAPFLAPRAFGVLVPLLVSPCAGCAPPTAFTHLQCSAQIQLPLRARQTAPGRILGISFFLHIAPTRHAYVGLSFMMMDLGWSLCNSTHDDAILLGVISW